MDNYKAHPLRVQRKRTKGYKLPSDAVVVTRPTKWGNPFPDALTFKYMMELCAIAPNYPWTALCMKRMRWIAEHVSELCGKRLACFCPLDHPCHADVLAEIANTTDDVSMNWPEAKPIEEHE